MEDEKLESVLERKYNITEKMVAEGNFVALCGIDKEAVQLTAAGITTKSFVVASITLSGEEKDYDLISITPLSLIKLGIQNYAEKKICVKSQFKATQIYQLCSCEEQDRIWIRFVKAVDSLQRKQNMYGDHWQSVSLEASIPLSGVDMQSADHEHALVSSVLVDMYPWRRDSDSCSSKSRVARSLSATSTCAAREIRINLSRSTSSLPESHTDNFTLEKESANFRKGQSKDSLNSLREKHNVDASASSLPDTHTDSLDKELFSFKQGHFNDSRKAYSAESLDKFRKRTSIDCLDVTSKTSSVFSDCEDMLVLDLESRPEPDEESLLNRSNNFLPAANSQYTDIANTDSHTNTEENNSSTKDSFFRRLFRRLFCLKKDGK